MEENESLVKKLHNKIDAYFISHVHLDHVSNIKFYENLKIPIYCPKPEDKFILNTLLLHDAIGTNEFMKSEFMVKIIDEFRASQLKHVNAFIPGETFTFGKITLETLAIPGHSPGHTGFLVSNTAHPETKKILFLKIFVVIYQMKM